MPRSPAAAGKPPRASGSGEAHSPGAELLATLRPSRSARPRILRGDCGDCGSGGSGRCAGVEAAAAARVHFGRAFRAGPESVIALLHAMTIRVSMEIQ